MINTKISYIIIVSVVATVIQCTNGAVQCAAPYEQINGYCLQVVKNAVPLNWWNAKIDCLRTRKGTLYIADSEEKQEAAEQLLNKYGHKKGQFWLDGTDSGQKGEFYWERTATDFSFSKWAEGEPSNIYPGGEQNNNKCRVDENCVAMLPGKSMVWNYISCDFTTRNYICEIPEDVEIVCPDVKPCPSDKNCPAPPTCPVCPPPTTCPTKEPCPPPVECPPEIQCPPEKVCPTVTCPPPTICPDLQPCPELVPCPPEKPCPECTEVPAVEETCVAKRKCKFTKIYDVPFAP